MEKQRYGRPDKTLNETSHTIYRMEDHVISINTGTTEWSARLLQLDTFLILTPNKCLLFLR